MTTRSAVHHPHATPRFHVSSCSAAQCLVVAFLCLSLVVGFIAQVLSGAAPRAERNPRTSWQPAVPTQCIA